ncbi:MAG TPA: hypothetical protein VF798_17025 [Burkholderiaceae bacterium]
MPWLIVDNPSVCSENRKCGDVMGLKDALRNFMGIRVERALPPPGPMPPLGSNIAMGKLRMRLKYPIDNRQWHWFSQKGWRTIDMRTDRRNYDCLPDEVLARLLASEGVLREELYEKILNLYGEPVEARVALRELH